MLAIGALASAGAGAAVASYVARGGAAPVYVPAAALPPAPADAMRLSAEEQKRAGIKVERLAIRKFSETLSAFGTVGPNRNRFARVTPPVAGRLISISVDLGAHVSEGAELAVLESPELADVRTAYQQNRTDLELTNANLDRARKLSKDAAVAFKDLLQAQADYERARSAAAALEAKLATLGVPQVAPAGTPSANLAVHAPFAGTIVERTAVLGEYGQAYQSLFTVADLSTVWVETNLFDRDLVEVSVGAPAVVTLAAYPGQRFGGKVTYIGNILDQSTRTAVARIEVANADLRLKPGLFANVEIDKGTQHEALRVPENAVVLLIGQWTAFTVRDGRFEPRAVELGERNEGMVIVTSGLTPGDEVVVEGAYALKARLLKAQLGSE
jgi:cobalt-zinc-cadmium efflux system membrane fusion protein